jgi:membrane-associated protease RseP (regulator of RpoE activity)
MSTEPSLEARWRSLEAQTDDVAPRTERGVRVHVWLVLATAFTMWLAHGPSYAAAMLLFLLCHEGGHYVACRLHGVSATLPYFLPAPPIFLPGTLGAVIRVRAPFPNRNALFDMGAAGPWGGFLIALPVLAIGLRLSTVSVDPPLMDHAVRLGDSLVTALMTRLVLGDVPDSVSLVYHPLAFAGWFGMLVTSLNLLPVGQLDGGHVAYAAGVRSRIFPLLLVAILAWLAWTGWPGWALWAGILLLMIVLGHPPTMDDLRPLSPWRRIGAVASMALLVITFVPAPISLAP